MYPLSSDAPSRLTASSEESRYWPYLLSSSTKYAVHHFLSIINLLVCSSMAGNFTRICEKRGVVEVQHKRHRYIDVFVRLLTIIPDIDLIQQDLIYLYNPEDTTTFFPALILSERRQNVRACRKGEEYVEDGEALNCGQQEGSNQEEGGRKNLRRDTS